MPEYMLYLNESHRNLGFPGNKVKTTKYSWLSFLPVCTFNQFRKPVNCYFLVLCIVLALPIVSPVHPITGIGPFSVVILTALVKEAVEDTVSPT